MTATAFEPGSYTQAGFNETEEDLLDPDEAIDAELDGDTDSETEPLDEEAPEEGSTTGAAGAKAKAATKPSRGVFRRVAAKTLEVQEAADTVRAVAASLLGSSEDVVELTTSIMAAPRMTNSPLGDIEAISDACREDPFEAAITAGALGRTRLKGIWSLLHAVGSVGTPAPPAADAKAALAVVKAVNKLTDDQHLDLASAGELLKRS